MRRLAAVLMLLPLPVVAQEAETLSCAVDGGEAFELMLAPQGEDGFHCVFAPELRNRAPFCASQGGWSVSLPGSSITEGYADDLRDLMGEEAGWLFAHRSPSIFVASASEGTDPPLALEVAGETFWRMRVSLETGEGVVETREAETALRCERR